MGVALCAAVLRLLIEVVMLAALAMLPAHSHVIRHMLERAALAILYLGLPAWLLARLLAA
jgi:apolipoprotein N-acyltransferase